MASGDTFIAVGHILPQVGWGTARHVHIRNHELILVVSGTLRTEIAGQSVVGHKGDVLFYPAGKEHLETALGTEPLETLFLAFYTPEGIDYAPWPLQEPDDSGRIEMLLRWMLDIQPAQGPAERRILESLALAAAYEYGQGRQRPENRMVLEVKRYIRAHMAERLTLDDLAAAAALSRFHFARLFRQGAGVTPMRFLQRMRVEAASALLTRTALPAKTIAAQVGFADEYHFSRVFRRLTGRPPGALRKRSSA